MVAVSAIELSEVVWRIVPTETPRILRRCARCGAIRRFASSDKFRLNAQQRKVDVWLIYKCLECESTWNCTIVSRRTPDEIGAALYLRFQQSDRELAWACAFDFSLLSRQGVKIDAAIEVRVECSGTSCLENGQQRRKIRLEPLYPGIIRLDRLLAEQLNVSRSQLQAWFELGRLTVWPEEKQALRKPVRNGQVVYLDQEN